MCSKGTPGRWHVIAHASTRTGGMTRPRGAPRPASGGGPSSQGLLVVFPVYTFGDTLGIYMAIIGLGARRHGVSGWGGPFLVNMY